MGAGDGFFFLLAYLLTSHTPHESNTLSIERTFFFSFDLACLLVLLVLVLLHLLQTCLSLIKFRLMTIILHIRANAAMEKKVAAIRPAGRWLPLRPCIDTKMGERIMPIEMANIGNRKHKTITDSAPSTTMTATGTETIYYPAMTRSKTITKQ